MPLIIMVAACMPEPPPLEPPPPAPLRIELAAPPPETSAAEPEIAPAPLAVARDFDGDALLRAVQAQPEQVDTPRVVNAPLAVKLVPKWSARVGLTTFRTTMAMGPGLVVIGTHGRSLDGKGEADDAVYLLDSATGAVKRKIKPPGSGDLDVGGIALDGDTVFFTSDNGFVVAAGLDGSEKWRATLKGKVRPAPSLGDLNGDGRADVVAGDEQGQLAALDGSSGKLLWIAATGTNDYNSRGFLAGAAIADVDGDGRLDVIAGARDGVLAAYRGVDGQVLWQVKHGSGIHASPSLADFDGDGQLEVLAAWSYSVLSILDAATGRELWGLELSQDGEIRGIEGLFGSPVPLPGAPGLIVQGTSWWGKEDSILLVGPLRRAFRSYEGRVSSTAIVGDLDDDGTPEAIIGTEGGALVALRSDGARSLLAQLPGAIEAPAMLADVDGDGTFELLVAANDGNLRCFSSGSRTRPLIARFRGNDAHNSGQLGAMPLAWSAAAATVIPKTGPSTSSGARLDYLSCCSDLQAEAQRAPSPDNATLLDAASRCLALAGQGKSRAEMQKAVAPLAGAALPASCR